ncbi:MAG: hypothetical protein IPP57_23310 [Candidatus Obscuribacter sp.]|jgi:hypothetical protein|nr:hypothetical protein [Candidatus Obscuribacter sp.]MBK9773707.1 hypothetical protein [Candidatus Obscuribacter sp.]MDQ5967358.1 hypothetical protein [Cyanobacteriota bacterium erpe_2018_sw_39hr_WHONDRS-SW48-000098_B_bin.30]
MTNQAAITDKQVDTMVEKVKQFQPLSEELNAIPFEDRLAMARAVEKQIAKERAPGDLLPALVVLTGHDSRGHEHLTNAQYTTPKGTADVYNLPGKIGKQSIKQEFKLDLDSAHSMHLETGGKEILYPKAGR